MFWGTVDSTSTIRNRFVKIYSQSAVMSIRKFPILWEHIFNVWQRNYSYIFYCTSTMNIVLMSVYHINFCILRSSIHIFVHNDGTCTMAVEDCIPLLWFCSFSNGPGSVWIYCVLIRLRKGSDHVIRWNIFVFFTHTRLVFLFLSVDRTSSIRSFLFLDLYWEYYSMRKHH